jgi:hypothetical protein
MVVGAYDGRGVSVGSDRKILLDRPQNAMCNRRPGMPVRFMLAGGPSQTFEGTVGSVMRAPTIVNEAVFYDAMIELDGEQHLLPFGRTVQAFIVVDRLDCAVLLPRQSLPNDAAPGGLIKGIFRDQAGNVVNRVLQLHGLNEVNGAIACDEASKAGINLSDRIIKIVSQRRGESR